VRNWVELALRGEGIGAQLVRALVGSAGLRIVGMGFGFLVGVQLARGLGPAGYGVYGIAMASIAVLMIPTELGLPQLIMREVSSAQAVDGIGATAAIVRWGKKIVLTSSLVIAGAVLCVLATGLVGVDSRVRATLMVGLLWIPVVAMGNIYGAALRGMHHIVSGQVGEFIVRPALVSLMLFLLVNLLGQHLSSPSAMGINVLGAIVAAGVSVVLFRRIDVADSVQGVPADLKFSHALPIAMSEGMRIVGAQIGMLVLAAMASKSDAGMYRVAYGIYTVTTMPSALVNVACAPTISNLNTQGRARDLARLNIFISIFLTGSAAAFFLVSTFFGRDAISLLFGRDYGEASAVLLIFLFGELLASMFGHPTVVLNMLRKQKVVMWWSAVALVMNFLVSVIMVRTIGYMGAAFGSALGLVIWRAGCSIFAKRRLGMDTALITKLLPAGFDDSR
jgi:O-antigen/teichoic acid export membrane protein